MKQSEVCTTFFNPSLRCRYMRAMKRQTLCTTGKIVNDVTSLTIKYVVQIWCGFSMDFFHKSMPVYIDAKNTKFFTSDLEGVLYFYGSVFLMLRCQEHYLSAFAMYPCLRNLNHPYPCINVFCFLTGSFSCFRAALIQYKYVLEKNPVFHKVHMK